MTTAKFGLVLGATVPSALGLWVMSREIDYRLTLAPNTPTCAMAIMGAWLLILFVAPVCGLIGATVGWLSSAIYCELDHGGTAMVPVPMSMNVPIIGASKVPFGGQTVYSTEMWSNGNDGSYREDIRLASWSRDTTAGKFQLSILAEDRETRLKLKSIVPVLEHAEHAR